MDKFLYYILWGAVTSLLSTFLLLSPITGIILWLFVFGDGPPLKLYEEYVFYVIWFVSWFIIGASIGYEFRKKPKSE